MFTTKSTLAAIVVALAAVVSARPFLAPATQSLFDASMNWQDQFWDERAGYLITADLTLPGRWDTRQTAWYSVGLLHRNLWGDVARAKRIINAIIDRQYTQPGNAWYGTYQQSPEEPLPGSPIYAANVYNSFDPNWRDFISTSWIVAIEEYSDLLGTSLVNKMIQSMKTSALGALSRVGLDGDNLLLTYTNPELMRTVDVAWLGYRLKDKNFTDFAENRAQQHYDIFTYKGFNTFPEYNVPTYIGIDIFSLALWIKYTPPTSKLNKLAPFMLNATVADLGEFYNFDLKNVAGPWDRTYGMDMTQYQSIAGLYIWSAIGREQAPNPSSLAGAWHVADFGFGHLVALTSPTALKYFPPSAISSFKKFSGEKTITRNIRSSPFNETFRTDTVWMNSTVAIGGQNVDEIYGFRSSYAYNPAVILFKAQPNAPTISWITFFAEGTARINATASKEVLDVVFPQPQQTKTFKWLVGGLPIDQGRQNLSSLEAIPGLPLKLTVENAQLSKVYYDLDLVIHLFHSYTFVYEATSTSRDIQFKFELK
ncbi:hypothetical protein BJ742DRAFT_781863 [Cladochytrium replicatum]|nr:hypothetical protein BJ742DRAFT_781863 [Cladochytrium replicatum]